MEREHIFRPVYRLAPEPFFGLAVDYNEDFSEQLKRVADIRAWDRSTRTWYFPRSLEGFITATAKQHGLIPDSPAIRKQREALYLTKGDVGTADDYAKLGLHRSAPAELVEIVMAYWRQRFSSFGAPATVLQEMEEAHARIYAQRVDDL